jgi:hypothetical protein
VYEAYRQRKEKGMYGAENKFSKTEQEALFQSFVGKHAQRLPGKMKIKRTK